MPALEVGCMSGRWAAGRQEAVVRLRASLDVSWAKRLLSVGKAAAQDNGLSE